MWGWIASRGSDGWKPALVVIRGHEQPEPVRYEYADVVVAVESLAPSEVVRRLSSGEVGKLSDGTSVPLRDVPQYATFRRMTTEPEAHGASILGGWPGLFLEERLPDLHSGRLSHFDHLVAPGRPFFVSSLAAAAELLVGVSPAEMGGDASARLIVALPDRRGALGPIKAIDGAIELSAFGPIVGITGAGLRVTWRTLASSVEWRRVDVTLDGQATYRFEMSALPYEFWVVLSLADGTVVDRRGWQANYGERPEGALTPVQQVERWVEGSEHSQLEYKRELGSDNNAQFAECVCAMANSSGGVILVGVADDGTVVGFGPREARAQIGSVIRDRVIPTPTFDVESIVVRSRPVQIVRVSPGPEGPYTIDHQVFVRVQSTVRRAMQHELRRLMSGASPAS